MATHLDKLVVAYTVLQTDLISTDAKWPSVLKMGKHKWQLYGVLKKAKVLYVCYTFTHSKFTQDDCTVICVLKLLWIKSKIDKR